MARNALGRGLGALIRDPEVATQATPNVAQAPTAAATAPAPVVSGGPLHVDIDLLDPSPYQPRTSFAEAALEELAQSIRNSGIIQPLVVRKIGSRYQLIAGERRWRAAQRAALQRVPVVLREVGDEQALELTLVENIQRADLHPTEAAEAIETYIARHDLSQREAARRLGKPLSFVAELLAIRLRTGSSRVTAIDLATTLLREFRSLDHLASRSLQDLRQYKGLGEAKSVGIVAAFELGRRAAAAMGETRLQISSPADVVRRYGPLQME